MLGELIYEQKGKISGYRVLDTENPTIDPTIKVIIVTSLDIFD